MIYAGAKTVWQKYPEKTQYLSILETKGSGSKLWSVAKSCKNIAFGEIDHDTDVQLL